MFLAQLALSLVVWAAVIVVLVRRRERLIAAAQNRSRGQRTLEAIGMLLGSIVILALTMAFLAFGGLNKDGFSVLGWVATTLAGAAFVSLQTLGLVPLVLNAVTTDRQGSSDRKDSHHS